MKRKVNAKVVVSIVIMLGAAFLGLSEYFKKTEPESPAEEPERKTTKRSYGYIVDDSDINL